MCVPNKIEKGINHVFWCMDSLRYDMFTEADVPHFHGFTDYRRVYSRAAITPPSIFGVYMNLSWYESRGATPVPWMTRWVWLPKNFAKEGYHSTFITSNPMMELYRDIFSRDINNYDMLKGCIYHGDTIVNKIIKIFDTVYKPKFIFALLMETHQPYPYKKNITQAEINVKYRPVELQKRSLEKLDEDFKRLTEKLSGTNTDILVFSDHGELDLKLEGNQGHGPGLFHPKLFEIPLGRAVV